MSDLKMYYENTQKPWGQLFYQTIWQQLSFLKSMHVLDFGSGFGITANHLASNNNVIAVEPNELMCNMRFQDYPYQQIVGEIEQLEQFPQNYFDAIVCHNVLEYMRHW